MKDKFDPEVFKFNKVNESVHGIVWQRDIFVKDKNLLTLIYNKLHKYYTLEKLWQIPLFRDLKIPTNAFATELFKNLGIL